MKWLKKILAKKQPEILMIAAIQNDLGIGYQGDLIHSIKNDMKHFMTQTNGHTVIMGRKNWESIPKKYRPLKNRQNIVVTRNDGYQAEGALTVASLEEAIAISDRKKIYIIGGGQMYTLGMHYADILDLALIDADKPADTFFPEFRDQFEITDAQEKMHDTKTGLNYRFTLWKRKV